FRRQQRRRLAAREASPHRRLQIPQHALALLRARRDHAPDPLAPAVARRAARPLRDVPVDHHEADRLLRQVVRRLHPRRRYERERRARGPAPPAPPTPGLFCPPARPFAPAAAPPPALLPAACAAAPPTHSRAGGTPRTTAATPRAAAPRRRAPAGRAASAGTSRRGSGAPGRTATSPRTRACSACRR